MGLFQYEGDDVIDMNSPEVIFCRCKIIRDLSPFVKGQYFNYVIWNKDQKTLTFKIKERESTFEYF
jgi:hypothetical protein